MSAASIKTVDALPPTELNSYRKAMKLYETKQYKKGTQTVNDILKKYPDVGEVLALRGLLLMNQKKKPEAFESIQRGLRNNVKSQFCWQALGMYHQDDDKVDEAIKSFRNAYRCQPGNFKLLLDLSLLEIRTRDLESYRDTKHELLKLKPNQSGCWISYAMAFHLLGDLEEAAKIMEQYYKMEPLLKTINYETSEFKLYMNMIYCEAGMYDKAIQLLEENKKTILDKTAVLENLGDLYLKTNQKEKGAKIFEELLERNANHDDYFRKLEQCSNLATVEQRIEFYKTNSEKYPRSDSPRKLPLEFLTGDLFKQALDSYMQRAIHKGIPPLFRNIKYLFTDAAKQKTALELALAYAESLEKNGTFSPAQKEKEPPTSLLWTYYYLAQHYDLLNDTQAALSYANKAIEHTPTVIELYLIKGKIYKHAGDVHEAAKWLDEAQSLDTADRGVNFKCAKYMLRAGIIDEAVEITAKTIPDEKKPMEFLKEIQCIWFEIELGEAHRRARKYGEALHKFHLVDQHFKDMIKDEFDFHVYCMRKMTLSAYVNMLRTNDHLRRHPLYVRSAKNAIEIYLNMFDRSERKKAGIASGVADSASEQGLSASELKKLKNKQKKQLLKAEQESDTKKKEPAATEKRDERAPPPVLEHDPIELENTQDPLEETLKFLQPLEKFASQHLETHTLGFEVYMRKKRFLLMLRSLKKIKQIEDGLNKPKAKFHYYLCKFLIEFNKHKSTLNENVLNVINAELKSVLPTETPVNVLNEEFLKKNSSNYECVIEAAKIHYDLKPNEESSRKQALDLLTNLSSKPSLKVLNQTIDLLAQTEYFGRLSDETLTAFKSKFKQQYPLASAFKSSADVELGLADCLKKLKISS